MRGSSNCCGFESVTSGSAHLWWSGYSGGDEEYNRGCSIIVVWWAHKSTTLRLACFKTRVVTHAAINAPATSREILTMWLAVLSSPLWQRMTKINQIYPKQVRDVTPPLSVSVQKNYHRGTKIVKRCQQFCHDYMYAHVQCSSIIWQKDAKCEEIEDKRVLPRFCQQYIVVIRFHTYE